MSLKHKDIHIPENSPFQNCKLDREQYAEVLTQIVRAYPDGFVLALNNEWGTGKTTFLNMWKQQLKNGGFKTIYLNAWENDFETNPLVTLLAELKKILPPDNDKAFKSLLQKGAIIAKNLIPAVAKAIVSNYVDIKGIDDVAEGAAKASTDLLSNAIDDYRKKQIGLLEFRTELQEYIKITAGVYPVVFIIDELDRCRPNYSVQILEYLKHFFSVSGIIFVLSIDKVQLGHAVKGVYGSENLNSEEYLRRFIDIEYTLPQPSSLLFCKYLYQYFEFDEFFEDPRRQKIKELKNDGGTFIQFASNLFSWNSLTLRSQEKILSHSRLSLRLFTNNNYLFPRAFILLIYILHFHKVLFYKIKNRELSPQEFLDSIENLFPKNLTEEEGAVILNTECLLLYTYNNYYKDMFYKSELTYLPNEATVYEFSLQSRLNISNVNQLFVRQIHNYERDLNRIKIDYLLSKVELFDFIKF